MPQFSIFSRFLALLSVLCLTACFGGSSTAHLPKAESASIESYQLANGDQLRVTTFNEENLSGDFTIDDSGNINLPLINSLRASGQTRRQLEQQITKKLSGAYLTNPKVTVDIIKFRPFYIVGEVTTPGSYDYMSSMTVLKAVATAGGYTPRADIDSVSIIRGIGAEQQELAADDGTQIMPGDSIRVGERLF